MKKFEVGKKYGSREWRMGGITVTGRDKKMIWVRFDTEKTDRLIVFKDRNGNEAATWTGSESPNQYSAAILMRV